MLVNIFHDGKMSNIDLDETLFKEIPQNNPLIVNGEVMGVIGKVVNENNNISIIIGNDYSHFYENFTNYNISKIKNSSDEEQGPIFVLK